MKEEFVNADGFIDDDSVGFVDEEYAELRGFRDKMRQRQEAAKQNSGAAPAQNLPNICKSRAFRNHPKCKPAPQAASQQQSKEEAEYNKISQQAAAQSQAKEAMARAKEMTQRARQTMQEHKQRVQENRQKVEAEQIAQQQAIADSSKKKRNLLLYGGIAAAGIILIITIVMIKKKKAALAAA